MNIEYHKYWSPNLRQEMEFKVYGQTGKPVIVFPSMRGRFYDFEDFHMLDAVSEFIDAGQFQFYTVDSVDAQSWANHDAPPAKRAERHQDYDRYIMQEVVPFIRERRGRDTMILTTGVSMGGYHSANFYFRHPDIFDSVISLSGLFELRMFVGDYMDDNVYFNCPLCYLPHLEDPWYLDRYRQGRIIICAGQGAWEEAMDADIEELRRILEAKHIPAWIDLWGHDVNHDWPWWQKMLPYFLGKLLTDQ
jgi:esterase/lipase superfamily enzyme